MIPTGYMIVDRATGTILGNDVVAVRYDDVTPEQWEDALGNDSEALAMADEYGVPLFLSGAA